MRQKFVLTSIINKQFFNLSSVFRFEIYLAIYYCFIFVGCRIEMFSTFFLSLFITDIFLMQIFDHSFTKLVNHLHQFVSYASFCCLSLLISVIVSLSHFKQQKILSCFSHDVLLSSCVFFLCIFPLVLIVVHSFQLLLLFLSCFTAGLSLSNQLEKFFFFLLTFPITFRLPIVPKFSLIFY